ncbi:MAG: hypothetical protein LBV41_05460 [Cytophagaceae bacterium]|jgi:hypothetical protein|nr:hypothetical protein [Cytophagaceae bacterium]
MTGLFCDADRAGSLPADIYMFCFMTDFPRFIDMTGLEFQYRRLRDEIDATVLDVMQRVQYINGTEVGIFAEKHHSHFLSVPPNKK